MKYVKSPFCASPGPLAFLLSLVFLAGCSLGSDPGSRVALRDEELVLVDIADSASYSRALSPGYASRAARDIKIAPGGATITLVAEVAPPEDASGTELQASHIAMTSNGKLAIVSYMLRGPGSSGAVDIIDISTPSRPVLLRTTLFPGFDIAAVLEESGRLYLAGQKIGSPDIGDNAYVLAIDYSATTGALNNATAVSIPLPGHFATDLASYNGLLYVTTGAYSAGQPGVGLFALRLAAGAFTIVESATNSYPDLRSVAAGGEYLGVFEAQSSAPVSNGACRLDVYKDKNLATVDSSVNLSAFPAQAEAKSKLGYFDGLFFVAANLSGVAIIDPDSGTLRASIPAPSLAGLAPELQSSNAVSYGSASGKDIVLIANGEAGLWVGDGDLIKDQTGGAVKSIGSINGSIRFGPGESVNYVAGKSGVVAAAVGTGGLKVLNMAIK